MLYTHFFPKKYGKTQEFRLNRNRKKRGREGKMQLPVPCGSSGVGKACEVCYNSIFFDAST